MRTAGAPQPSARLGFCFRGRPSRFWFKIDPPRGATVGCAVVRNIIFDWSGTLVDDLPAVWRASNYVFQQAGIEGLSLERFRAEFSLPFQGFYDRYTPHIPLAQLEAWFHEEFRKCQDQVEALPHALEFLNFCRERKVRIFLLSAVHPEHYARQSAATGLGELIEKAYVGVWDKRAEIHQILARHGLSVEETLFVGDMQHDVETAHHGGVRACAVLTGYNRLEQLRASQPDLIVEHLGELRELLTRNGGDLKPSPSAYPPLPVVTVGAAVFHPREDRVLMVRTHKWSDLWGIPGGKVKYGESCPDALRRELQEETGLQVEEVRFVLVQDCIHSREFYRDAHFVLLNYTGRCVGDPQVRLNDEAREFQWASFPEALALPLNQPTRVLLEEILRQRKT